MSSRTRLFAVAFAVLVSIPAPAYAATTSGSQTIPEWLSMAAGGVGLVIAIVLLVDAVLLHRVAEGSMVADNIAYMMSGVVCFGAAMLARWVAIFTSEPEIAEQVGWAADLLVTVGMALLAVYFMRVRRAMQRYIDAAASAYPGVGDSLGEGAPGGAVSPESGGDEGGDA